MGRIRPGIADDEMEGTQSANTTFTLTAARALAAGRLELRYADAEESTVDLSPVIGQYASLAELGDPEVFMKARLGECGGSVS